MKKLNALWILLAACLWGTIGISVKGLGSFGASAMQIVFLRAVATVLLLTPILLIYNKKLLKIKLKDIWCFIGTGIISIVFFTYFNFYTISLTSMSFASVLMYTAPFMMVFLAAVIFKEKITGRQLLACVIAFSGCMLVSGIFEGDTAVTSLGILTGLASGFFYALYTVFSRFALIRGYDPLTITLYTFIFSVIGSLPFVNVKETFGIITDNPKSLIFVAAIAVFNTILPYILYNTGLRGVQSSTALIIATAEPVVATVMGFAVYQEIPTVLSVIGIVLVVCAVLVLNIKKEASN